MRRPARKKLTPARLRERRIRRQDLREWIGLVVYAARAAAILLSIIVSATLTTTALLGGQTDTATIYGALTAVLSIVAQHVIRAAADGS